MATTTTNYSFTLPTVGGDTDAWGSQLNANWTSLDSTLKTVADSVGNPVTLTGNDYLTISGQAITVGDVDLTTDVTGTLPVSFGGTGVTSLGTANQVLAVNATADGLEFQTVSGSGTVTSVTVSGSDGIEVDSGSPITTSGTIALGINSTTLSTHLGLGTAATTDSTAYATSTQGSTADSALQDVSDDSTPQLGGNLDVVTHSIVSTSGRDINLTPDTTGNVVLGNFSFDADQTVGLSEDNYVLTYNNTSGQISLEAASVTESQISDFGSYQAEDAGLTSIAGLTTAADKMIYTTDADTYAVTSLSSFARTILDDADASAVIGTLGLSSLYATVAQGSTADSATQPGDLATTLNVSATDKLLGRATTGAGAVEEITLTSAGRALLDDANNSDQRDTLGLGSISTQAANAVNIDGGAIDGVTIGTNAVATDLRVDNLQLDGNTISSTDTNGNLALSPNGTGNVSLGNFTFDVDQTVGVGQDNYVLTYDHSTTSISLEAASGGGGSGSSYIEHSSTVSDSLAINSGTNRLYVGGTTFSGSGTMAGRLVTVGGAVNFTGSVNTTGVLVNIGVP